MNLEEKKNKLQKLLNLIGQVNSLAVELDVINYLQNNPIYPSTVYVKELLDNLNVNMELSNNSGMSYELAEMLKHCPHSNLGYYVSGGTYLKVKDNRIYKEIHPWNYYGGMDSNTVSSRDEITQFEAISMLKKRQSREE